MHHELYIIKISQQSSNCIRKWNSNIVSTTNVYNNLKNVTDIFFEIRLKFILIANIRESAQGINSIRIIKKTYRIIKIVCKILFFYSKIVLDPVTYYEKN